MRDPAKLRPKPLKRNQVTPCIAVAQPRCTWYRHISQSLPPIYGTQRGKSQTLMCKTIFLLRLPARYTKVFNGALHRVIPPGRELPVIKPICGRLAGVPRALAEFVTECLAESKHILGCCASYSGLLIIVGVVARFCWETSFLLQQELVSLDTSNPSRVFQELAGFPGDIRSNFI